MMKNIIILSTLIALCACSLYDCNQNCQYSNRCNSYNQFTNCINYKSACFNTDDCNQYNCYNDCKTSSQPLDTCQFCYKNCSDQYPSCSTSRTVAIIVGVVVGGVFLIIIIAGCYFYQKRKQQRQKIQDMANKARLQQDLQQMQFQQNMQQQNVQLGYSQPQPYINQQPMFIPPPQYQVYNPNMPMMYQQPNMNAQGYVVNNNPQAKVPAINNVVL
ncbi:transmembrane protein, putative (macronuclear) [Tetrahymena thermophila SB210]|uniref:Transmembrane protein, putative n=1 Tax=Tetrahymena thermophila (strain SB210) TaxID=312017 RepID=Q22UB8_TETTS|nr:transmembrane protein, putative [Tetrahymena thermophila SB210]EAR88769.1 transmembrane protein, putative [Tetrahymena thermophila SB210]|eukprot:XP_001009014.1 transmembrane protein, putative [Tetrahymena thermophila SB210]